jgi:hypothetical protein
MLIRQNKGNYAPKNLEFNHKLKTTNYGNYAPKNLEFNHKLKTTNYDVGFVLL